MWMAVLLLIVELVTVTSAPHTAYRAAGTGGGGAVVADRRVRNV